MANSDIDFYVFATIFVSVSIIVIVDEVSNYFASKNKISASNKIGRAFGFYRPRNDTLFKLYIICMCIIFIYFVARLIGSVNHGG